MRAAALTVASTVALSIALSYALEAGAATGAADPAAVAELLRNAQMWRSLDRPDNARLVLVKLLAIDADQPQALLMLGELELRAGRTAEAQRLLARLQRSGAHAAASELQDLVRIYTRDLSRLNQLRLLRRGGNDERALALARELFPGGSPPGALSAEFAGLLGVRPTGGAKSSPSGKARPTTTARPGRAMPASPAPTAATAAEREAERYWPLLREAEALRDAGRLAEAAERTATARQLQPGEPEAALLAADIDQRQGRSAIAEATYQTLLDHAAARSRAVPRLIALLEGAGRPADALSVAARQAAPDAIDIGSLRAAADARVALGQPGLALRWLEDGLTLRPREPWLRHDLAQLYARLGQVALGREVVAEGVAAAPDDAEMRYAAALFYAAVDLDTEALATLDGVPEGARTDGQLALALRLREARARRTEAAMVLQAEARRRRDAQAARRQPMDEVALFPYYRDAAPGRSTLRGVELPLVLTRSPSDGEAVDEGRRWLHLDLVQLDAGALPATLDEAALFGQVRAAGLAMAAALPQRARGLSAGAGWTGDDRRWDLGVIGAGFDVPNLVGGWRQTFELNPGDLAVELSRRVLTGSLLSYAGARDPVSGQRWGGVTLSAASLRLGRAWSDFSSSVSLRAGLLTGRHVASNSTVQLRLSVDRDWLSGPTLNVNAGLTLALWQYRRNLGNYTYGQGGYYSPQRYTSLGLPLQLQGRIGLWSYQLRPTVSRAWTFEADAPYYPTDAALQARAGNPVHAGGSGGGWSTSLRADLERGLGDGWSVGASYIADRSAYYAPTQWLFYLRRGGQTQPGQVPLPRPLQPYSQF